MSRSNPLASNPGDILTSLLERFHSDKVSAMMPVSDSKPVLITSAGRTTTTEIAAPLKCDLKYGLPLTASARHVYVAGDFALTVLDRSIDGKGLSRNTLEVQRAASCAAQIDDGSTCRQ